MAAHTPDIMKQPKDFKKPSKGSTFEYDIFEGDEEKRKAFEESEKKRKETNESDKEQEAYEERMAKDEERQARKKEQTKKRFIKFYDNKKNPDGSEVKRKCECGSVVAYFGMSRHRKTKKHKKLMDEKAKKEAVPKKLETYEEMAERHKAEMRARDLEEMEEMKKQDMEEGVASEIERAAFQRFLKNELIRHRRGDYTEREKEVHRMVTDALNKKILETYGPENYENFKGHYEI